jgi:hypothetical protein
MQHVCHAVGCHVPVARSRLMCIEHWFMVPTAMRKRIWVTFVPGQEVSRKPSREYVEAARDAINYVARLEGQRELPTFEDIVIGVENSIKNDKE